MGCVSTKLSEWNTFKKDHFFLKNFKKRGYFNYIFFKILKQQTVSRTISSIKNLNVQFKTTIFRGLSMLLEPKFSDNILRICSELS